jgi:hypothetical protein
MKRLVLAIVITGVLALATALPHPVVAGALRDAATPTSEATSGALPCSDSDGVLLLAQAGCCQRQGGVCGCRNGTPKCCNGTMGNGCPCRGNTTDNEATFIEAL